MRPNLLLVVFDTARADAFEPFGAPGGTTPTISRMVADGATATTVGATSNWTLPSHASLFSGLLPHQLGLQGRAPRQVLGDHSGRFLSSVLGDAGWATGGVSANAWVSRAYGFAAGFDQFVDIDVRRHVPGDGLVGRIQWSADAARARLDDGMAAVERVFDHWMFDRDRSEPFFWFANLMECHSPYLPPRPYNDLRVTERLRAGRDARKFQSRRGFVEVCLGDLAVPAASLDRMRHLYLAGVRSMDDWLARMLDGLRRSGEADRTLVVVTSDHGENLGENGLLGHTLSIDERLVRVPLIVYGPGHEHFETCSSIADIPLAVSRALGVDPVPWRALPVPAGVAVAQADGFSGLDPAMAQRLIDGWDLPPRVIERLTAPMSAVRQDQFKLVLTGDRAVLHDLDHDPLEEDDVSDLHPDIVSSLTGILDDLDRHGREPPLTPAMEPAAAAAPELDESLERRLKLLGYL
ncbi:MAG TPA: sulfatase-like hydrolase/transferase [Acidimicrobiales bacterium]